MFNTSMMAKNLKEQKSFGDRIEKMMVAQVVELEECKDLIDREIQKRRDLEDRLQVIPLGSVFIYEPSSIKPLELPLVLLLYN